MNKNIEIVFKKEVYTDWKMFKRVIEALTKNRVKSIADYTEPRENLNMRMKRK